MIAFKFKPLLKSVLWGGDRIKRYCGLHTDQTSIGESWMISGVPGHETVVSDGEDAGKSLSELISKYGAKLVGGRVFNKYGNMFPLLIKVIDAKEDLSVQVHPDDDLAQRLHNSLGKSEMWYIVDADPESKIYAGFSKKIDKNEYFRLIDEGRIMDVVASHASHSGDVFYTPAGRIHSIGAGNMLIEVQQTSDITYRVYDFDRCDQDGKLRELHTELAAEAIDYNVYPDYKKEYNKSGFGMERLVDCQYFNVARLVLDGSESLALPTVIDSFMIVICVEGSVNIGGRELSQGESMLIPAIEQNVTAEGSAVLLTVTA